MEREQTKRKERNASSTIDVTLERVHVADEKSAKDRQHDKSRRNGFDIDTRGRKPSPATATGKNKPLLAGGKPGLSSLDVRNDVICWAAFLRAAAAFKRQPAVSITARRILIRQRRKVRDYPFADTSRRRGIMSATRRRGPRVQQPAIVTARL